MGGSAGHGNTCENQCAKLLARGNCMYYNEKACVDFCKLVRSSDWEALYEEYDCKKPIYDIQDGKCTGFSSENRIAHYQNDFTAEQCEEACNADASCAAVHFSKLDWHGEGFYYSCDLHSASGGDKITGDGTEWWTRNGSNVYSHCHVKPARTDSAG